MNPNSKTTVRKIDGYAVISGSETHYYCNKSTIDAYDIDLSNMCVINRRVFLLKKLNEDPKNRQLVRVVAKVIPLDMKFKPLKQKAKKTKKAKK